MTDEVNITHEIVVPNRLGLHIRASALFVDTVNEFPVQVTVHHNDKRANGKSIMGIMSLGASQGSTLVIEICADQADDANACWQAISKLINNYFNEPQETD